MQGPKIPRPFGAETLSSQNFDAIVEALSVAYRSRAALWTLVRAGGAAAPAVRRGLAHPDPAVRRGCAEVFDHSWDEGAVDGLVALLEDRDPAVRWMASHALACERCKRPTSWVNRARI